MVVQVVHLMLMWVRRHLVGMRKRCLGAVSPCNGFRCPVLVIIVDISPFVLPLGIVFIQATSHVNSILLELLICKLFRLGRSILVPHSIWIWGSRRLAVGARGKLGQ